MTPLARQTLRTYAEGMGLEYAEVVRHWLKLDATKRGRFLVIARRLEDGWREEMAVRAMPSRWERFVARVRATLRRWRQPTATL